MRRIALVLVLLLAVPAGAEEPGKPAREDLPWTLRLHKQGDRSFSASHLPAGSYRLYVWVAAGKGAPLQLPPQEFVEPLSGPNQPPAFEDLDPAGSDEPPLPDEAGAVFRLFYNLVMHLVGFYGVAILTSYLARDVERARARLRQTHLDLSYLQSLYGDIIESILAVTDLTIIPLSPSPLDLWSCQSTLEMIEEIQPERPGMEVRLLINRKIQGTRVGREARESVEKFDTEVLNIELCQRVAFIDVMRSGILVMEIQQMKIIQLIYMIISGNLM